MRHALAIAVVLLLSGCTTITQTAETSGTNEVRRTTLTVRSIGDAKQVVEKLQASNGKTHSLGAKGVEQETTSEIMERVVRAAVEAAAKGARP
jgi:hypothetical protein